MNATENTYAASTARADGIDDLAIIASHHSNSTIRAKVWRSSRETRIYADIWNGSRCRPWMPLGYYKIDESAKTWSGKGTVKQLHELDAIEAALDEWAAK